MNAVCNLGMATDSTASSTTTNDLLSPFVRSHLADHGIDYADYAANSSDCSTEEMRNSATYITRSNSTINNTHNHFAEKLGFFPSNIWILRRFYVLLPRFPLCFFSHTGNRKWPSSNCLRRNKSGQFYKFRSKLLQF